MRTIQDSETIVAILVSWHGGVTRALHAIETRQARAKTLAARILLDHLVSEIRSQYQNA